MIQPTLLQTIVTSAGSPVAGTKVGLVLDSTAFYAESGGQIFDTGFITSGDGETEFSVTDVKKRGPYSLHVGEVCVCITELASVFMCISVIADQCVPQYYGGQRMCASLLALTGVCVFASV